MCEGFGLIVSKEMEYYFCEPEYHDDCSHSLILQRLGWKENKNQHLRKFVRVQFPNWISDSFSFDEEETLPGWVENNRNEIKEHCTELFELCDPILTEYHKICDTALTEYDQVFASARAEYRDRPWNEYKNIGDVAWDVMMKKRDAAWAMLIHEFSMIKGYVPKVKCG